MCGENAMTKLAKTWAQGSPPHVRGKPCFSSLARLVVGITPACAGKTRHGNLVNVGFEDHPRMCGENKMANKKAWEPRGSPPHVRGKLGEPLDRLQIGRITPACAGKTICPSSRLTLSWDHPRMCGENQMVFTRTTLALGSPPHVRGKLLLLVSHTSKRRITPACAGKTRISSHGSIPTRDHPRMCGENQQIHSLFRRLMGSPPHVRGKPD